MRNKRLETHSPHSTGFFVLKSISLFRRKGRDLGQSHTDSCAVGDAFQAHPKSRPLRVLEVWQMTTLKRCPKCGIEKPATKEFFARNSKSRDGFHSLCKTCAADYGREWRKNNAERLAASKREYAESNKERLAEYQRNYHAVHREEKIERTRLWVLNNREKSTAYHRRYTPQWRAANPEKNRAIDQRRYARLCKANGGHTGTDVQAQYKRQKGKCFWCGVKVGDAYHVDHVVPLARGGSNGPENLVISCAPCNQSKGAKLPHEWPRGNRLI